MTLVRLLHILRHSLITLFAAFFAFLPSALAHPLDITNTVFTVHDTTIQGVTFFHPFEIQYLLSKTITDARQYDFQSYFDQADTLFAYLKQHLHIAVEGTPCTFAPVSMPHKQDYELLARGIELHYVFTCSDPITSLNATVTLFADDFPLQTNRLSILYPPTPGQPLIPEGKGILTARVTEYVFNPNRKPLALDTDKDSIPDDEERIYRTNPALYDTDADGYSDGEEVYNGWDPAQSSPSPGQGGGSNSGHIFGTESSAASSSDPFATGPLQHALQRLTTTLKDPTLLGITVVLGMVFLLGLFHALSVGHGKTLLASYLIDGNRTFTQGILFSGVLTLTHLADVLLLGLVFSFMAQLGFIAEWMNTIQLLGVAGLFLLSSYLLYSAIMRLRARAAAPTTKNAPTILMAFLAGLAPCTFGWSILLVLISLGQAWLAIPLLLAFGLGIFSCLIGVAFFVSYIQRTQFHKYRPLAQYAPVASSALLVTISLSIGYQMFSGTFIA